MSTDEAIADLGLIQLSDSFFPTGLYSTSNGLESIFSQKKISTKEELVDLIAAQIEQQVGPSDCVALANAMEFAKKGNTKALAELDNTVFAMRAVKEIREASTRSGAQLLKAVSMLQQDHVLDTFLKSVKSGDAPGTYSVSFGVCCNALNIDKPKSALSFLYGFTVSIVGAALRLGIIQHFEGQQAIHELKKAMAKAASAYCDCQVSDIWQFAPQIEIYQMHHGQSDSRMFIT